MSRKQLGEGLAARPVPMTASTPRRLAADRALAAALVQVPYALREWGG